uniref:DUF4283 domain-containing protein n=1 Tax=Populus alba TaxID=43335 RepID=A0A4U5NQV5_POPAL|nr:hypothetical protein D5086_0000250360 [Populus alba]
MHRSPSIVPPLSSSPSPFGQNIASPVSNKSRHDPSTKTSSLRSRPAVGNLNHGSLVGVVALPTSPGKDKASSGSHRPPSPNHPSGTTIPQSPFLVHFSDYIASSSCQFLETDLGMHKDLWKFSLIGFIVGKFPGYSSLSKFVNCTWKCSVKFSIHDSGWLIFTFTSETDMFDCWSPLYLSKLASVIGKPVHSDSPTTSKTRLSYARVLVEINLLVDLPTSINIILLNGDSLSQKDLGSHYFFLHRNSSHKHKKHSQTAPAPFRCSSPLAETIAVEKQSIREEPQGELGIDPISVKAAMAVEERVVGFRSKRDKLGHSNATIEPPPRRQYLRRSKAAATYHSRKSLRKSKSSSSANSRTQGRTVSSPSSSL